MNRAIDRTALQDLRAALENTRTVAHQIDLHSCDVDDLDNIIEPAVAELDADLPNINTLTTYLNSLARSLRAEPGARTAVLQLDAAMRNAGVPTHWEH